MNFYHVDKSKNWWHADQDPGWRESLYKDYAKKTVNWLDSDSQNEYKKNLKNDKKRKLLESLGWTDNNVKYIFNEEGFRSDTFKNKCDILFNGCSHTVCVGLPIENCWTKIVASYFDVGHHNIAVGGSDWAYITQRSLYWIPILKPKILILNEPPPFRFGWWSDLGTEWFTKENDNWSIITYSGGGNSENDNQKKRYATERCTLSTKKFTELNEFKKYMNSRELKSLIDLVAYDKNIRWFRHVGIELHKMICKENNCSLLIIPPGRLNTSTEWQKIDLARDLLHYGIQEQKLTSDLVIKIMNEKFMDIW